jgi:hypothetical protein
MNNSQFEKLAHTKMTRKVFLKFCALAFISLFGVTSVIGELISHAESPYASSEAESGALTGGAKATDDGPTTIGAVVVFENVRGDSSGTQAVALDTMADFIGVNTHMTFGGTPYLNKELVTAVLGDIGFRNIRDGWSNNTPSLSLTSWLIANHASYGLRLSWFIDPAINGGCTPDTICSFIASQQGLADCLAYLEGPNEWDLANGDVTGGGFTEDAAGLPAVMSAIYTARSAHGLSAVPILGPSIGYNGSRGFNSQVGNIAQYIDYNNCHDYWGADDSSTANLAEVITAAQEYETSELIAVKKCVTTEFGWNDSSGAAGNPQLTDQVIAIDLIRSHFMRYNSGQWIGSYVFMLFDDDSGWGICDPTSLYGETGSGYISGSPAACYKPQAIAHKSLLSLISDPDTSFTPGKLNFSLSGLGLTSDTQSNLFQKSDGSFWLAVWQANDQLFMATGSQTQATIISPAPVRSDITLTLNSNTAVSITQYLPASFGTTAVTTVANASLATITTGPEVNLVKIVL